MYLVGTCKPHQLRGNDVFWSSQMKVTFGNAALATLCNSVNRLTQRFGPDLGRAVGQRLLDIAASTSDSLSQIPGAQVTVDGSGVTRLAFSEEIVVRGIVSPRHAARETSRDEDRMLITALHVEERTGL
jgi:hypothetical protein